MGVKDRRKPRRSVEARAPSPPLPVVPASCGSSPDKTMESISLLNHTPLLGWDGTLKVFARPVVKATKSKSTLYRHWSLHNNFQLCKPANSST